MKSLFGCFFKQEESAMSRIERQKREMENKSPPPKCPKITGPSSSFIIMSNDKLPRKTDIAKDSPDYKDMPSRIQKS